MIDFIVPALRDAAKATCKCITASLLLLTAPAWSAPDSIKPFLESHCFDCHDSDTHKGGLNLDDFAFDPTRNADAVTWERVFDRVSRGEMPPKSKRQPDAEQKATWLAELSQSLRAAPLAMQQKEGRGPVRRLTRNEYENTVCDLLHIKRNLKSLFPEDAVTAGFDKVGEGLTLFATHFVRCQEASEKALGDAAGILHSSEDGPELFKHDPNTFADYGNWVWDSNFVVTSRMFYPYTVVMGPWAPLSGRYRVRITAQARNNGGKPMPVAIGIHNHQSSKPDAPDMLDIRDVPENEIRTFSARSKSTSSAPLSRIATPSSRSVAKVSAGPRKRSSSRRLKSKDRSKATAPWILSHRRLIASCLTTCSNARSKRSLGVAVAKGAPRARSADMATVRRNTLTLCGWHSIEVGQIAAPSERIRIEDNLIRDSKTAGIFLLNVQGAVVCGNIFESVTDYFIPTDQYQSLLMKDCTDIRVSDEVLKDDRLKP